MRLPDSIRFRIGTLFQRSQIHAEMEEELRSHIAHRLMIWSARVSTVAKLNAVLASNLARAKSTKRRFTKRRAGTLSERFLRMCAIAFACSASHLDSRSPRS